MFAGLDAASALHEREEDVEFDRGEGEQVLGLGDGAGAGVGDEVADGDGGGGGFSRQAAGAAQDGAQAGEELTGGEGFGQVVVGAGFEANDAVGFVAEAGEHQHGDGGSGPESLQDFEAIEPGHHDVEDDGIEVALAGQVEPGESVVGGGNGIAKSAEVFADEATELLVVVDYEDVGTGGGHQPLLLTGVAEKHGIFTASLQNSYHVEECLNL